MKTIAYRCFADTDLGGVDLGFVQAYNDEDAMEKAMKLIPGTFGYGLDDTVRSVACVWERHPDFYTAKDIRDLEEP